MRQETVTLYTFNELSDNAKQHAIDKERESICRHGNVNLESHYEDLQYELKNNPNFLAEFSEEYCLKNNIYTAFRLSQVKAIYSIKLDRLDVDHGDCRIKLELNSEKLLAHCVSELPYSDTRKKRIQALVDSERISFGCQHLDYYGNGIPTHLITEVCRQLDADYLSLESEIKTDIEHYIILTSRSAEEYLYSDEFIKEDLENQDHIEYTEDGERY